MEELEIKRRIDTTQIAALSRRAGVLGMVLETWGELLSLRLQEKTNNYQLYEGLTRSKLIITITFDHITKKYMLKPESVIEKKMHKIHWDFQIQMDHLILAR